MSLLKCKHECITLLDFTKTERLSKNVIKNNLRNAELKSYFKDKSGNICRISYDIIVGAYLIRLCLNSKPEDNKYKLRDYGNFNIIVMEKSQFEDHENYFRIPSNNKLFCSQYWYGKQMRIKDLINAIIFCNRLNQLKIFL